MTPAPPAAGAAMLGALAVLAIGYTAPPLKLGYRGLWLLGTHHGAVPPAHLDDHPAEFAFRFNRRSSRSRGLLFYRLLEQAAMSEPVTYRDVAIGR
jgi:hypothetical protein